ncbi:AraC family transcriptional regulator [Anaerotaenia torta]|uniref:helix-turn-helix transcriptional regulator n=1 Tax=Anaerotaenia torta TaxID=433293 RepID=UPI003D23C058
MEGTALESNYYIETRDMNGNSHLQFSSHLQEADGIQVMTQAHIHNYIEIIYAISGKFQILLNNRIYYFGEGDMVLINANEIHKIHALTQGLNRYIVTKFEPEMLYTTAQPLFEMKYVMPFILNESTHQKIFGREEIEKTVVPDMIHGINREFAEKRYGYELAIRANIYNLFLFILRRWNEQNVDLNIDEEINGEIVKRLQDVFDYIESHYQEDITALQMAARCNLSYSYFSRLFTRIMKRSFREYLNYVRITKAERLLASSDLNITEIALQVGFSTSSYFIRQFKHYKDISPKQYQLKYQTV